MIPNGPPNPPVRVMTVDDSPVVRRLVERVLERSGFEVVAELSDGGGVVEAAREGRVDVVILDLEMPERSGHEAVSDLVRAGIEVGVVIYAGSSKSAAKALADSVSGSLPCRIVAKGEGAGGGIDGISDRLVPVVRDLGLEIRESRARAASLKESRELRQGRPSPATVEALRPTDFGLLLVGSSTGGPDALRQVLAGLPADFPIPTVVVQHMPAGFTEQMAKRLDSQCAIEVREARDAELLQPGCVLIAPGGQHLELHRSGNDLQTFLSDGPPENSCRPAVDVLFRTAAEASSQTILAVVLTGMGHDGVDGMAHVRGVGGWSIAQDEATSVVWGMPGAVIKAGLTNEVLPLPEIGARIVEHVIQSGTGRRAV